MSRTTLYKLDASQKIREWVIWQEDRNHLSTVFIRHGLLNGEKQFDKLEYKKPELAKTEMERRISLMRNRRGYTDHVPVTRPFRPMLAQTYHPGQTRLPEHVYVQPKLNGERCLAAHNYMMSRKGTYFRSCPHIQQVLSFLPPEIVLDGELYLHGKSLQQIHSFVSKDRETEESLQLEYHVFDIVDEKIPFHVRQEMVADIVNEINLKFSMPNPKVKVVVTTHATATEVPMFFDLFLKGGYEGLMIRFAESFYELNVRSFGLYKYKPKQHKWFKIVDVIPGTGRSRFHGIAKCVTDDGKHFKCALSMPDYVKQQFLNNKSQYIGKMLFVEFIDYSDDGIPTHLSGKDIK